MLEYFSIVNQDEVVNYAFSDGKMIFTMAEYPEPADDEIVNFHPCRYTATLSLKKSDLLKFLDFTGHEIIYEK